MRLFKGKSQKDWENFLRIASDEELSAQTWKYTQEMRVAKRRKLEIAAERDRRIAENPPEPGQIVKVGGGR